MKKIIPHLVIALSGMVTVWLFASFTNANLNPFTLPQETREVMCVSYVFIQVFAQGIYSVTK